MRLANRKLDRQPAQFGAGEKVEWDCGYGLAAFFG